MVIGSFLRRSDDGRFLGCDAAVLACAGGGGERELDVSGVAGVAGSGVGPGADDQGDGFVDGQSPGVPFAAGVAFGATVVGAGAAELAEGDRVAAGFGQEVAAITEHVRPGPEPCLPGAALAAELPGGGDHPLVVGLAAQVLDVGLVLQPVRGQTGDGQGLGGVLGDVVGDGLVVQRLSGAGDVVAADRPHVGALRRAETQGDGAAGAVRTSEADGGG